MPIDTGYTEKYMDFMFVMILAMGKINFLPPRSFHSTVRKGTWFQKSHLPIYRSDGQTDGQRSNRNRFPSPVIHKYTFTNCSADILVFNISTTYKRQKIYI